MRQEYKGYTISIVQDTDPTNPREFDNIGKMICFHRRYDLGDVHSYKSSDYSGWNDLMKTLKKDFKNDVVLRVYMLDHSGLSVNTTGFSCPWDSGQIGFIILDRKQLYACTGIKRLTSKVKSELLLQLKNEVEEYNSYLSGDAYGYKITDSNGEVVDSCYGYLGSDGILEEAKAVVDSYLE